MILLSKRECRHIYGIARDKAHNGEFIDDDFLRNERPNNGDYKRVSVKAWKNNRNAEFFPCCPVCGAIIKSDYLNAAIESAQAMKPDFVRKYETMITEHNEEIENDI